MSTVNAFQEIKKCITFIFLKKADGTLLPNGTGFFVSVPSSKDASRFHIYLVTAKHVIQDENGNFYPSIVIRLNTNNGSSELIEIKLGDTGARIFTHQDPDVDIALFPCLPNENTFDFKALPQNLITTQETIKTLEIGEGDEVFFSGLFTSHIGQKRNQPIIRFGKVSLMPDEKIEWKEKDKPVKLRDLYLLECQSYGGNSGSPVFFHLAPFRKPNKMTIGPSQIHLAGLMTGSFLNANQISILETSNAYSLQNVGIAAITPAYKLYEILFSDILTTERAK